jgi:hypothetical protein
LVSGLSGSAPWDCPNPGYQPICGFEKLKISFTIGMRGPREKPQVQQIFLGIIGDVWPWRVETLGHVETLKVSTWIERERLKCVSNGQMAQLRPITSSDLEM